MNIAHLLPAGLIPSDPSVSLSHTGLVALPDLLVITFFLEVDKEKLDEFMSWRPSILVTSETGERVSLISGSGGSAGGGPADKIRIIAVRYASNKLHGAGGQLSVGDASISVDWTATFGPSTN